MNKELKRKVLNSFERLELIASTKNSCDLLEAIEFERDLIARIMDKDSRSFKTWKVKECKDCFVEDSNVLRN